MRGQVSDHRAIISLSLKGSDSAEIAFDAIVDTGFTEYLTLPLKLIDELGFPRRDTLQIILADGSRTWATEYQGRILWNEAWQQIPIQATAGDILVGMQMMEGSQLNVDVVEGDEVTVVPLE